jgi:hypothetical protein
MNKMKKAIFLSVVFFLFSIGYTNAQLSKFVKNVSSNVKKDLLGDKSKNSGKKTEPEPACACADAQLIFDLGGKLQIEYSEVSLTTDDDGNILVQDKVDSKYYIVKEGITSGPYVIGDPALESFGISKEDDGNKIFVKYRKYITKDGDKFLITFMGEKYGPYGLIHQFAVSRTKEKFAAIVTQSLPMSEDRSKKMEEAMKNAKTDQEKMNLSMQFAQEMQNQIMKDGGTDAMLPKFISNIPGVVYDQTKTAGASLTGNFKYDDILLGGYDKVLDLKGNTILTFPNGNYNRESLFISADNSRYANFLYGTLTFNDKSTIAEVFNPHWLKAEGKVYLAYMYYSPKNNAIMQCKIPF